MDIVALIEWHTTRRPAMPESYEVRMHRAKLERQAAFDRALPTPWWS